MIRTFIQSPQFTKAWDEYIKDDEELRKIEIDIMKNPKKYPVIPGTGSLRKMRWMFGGKGKRGGIRICYVDYDEYATTYLMLLYAKNEKEDLTNEEAKQIKEYINQVKDYLKKKEKV